MADVIKLPPPTRPIGADEAARIETEHKQRLFDWCDELLKALGYTKKVRAARTILELQRITLDAESAEVTLAIRDALHPASGRCAEHFRHLKEAAIKQVLKARLAQLKRDREAGIKKSRPKPSWEDDLIIDLKIGKIKAVLANLELILRESPKWKGVLAYNDFAAQVIIRKPTPWGDSNTTWSDHREAQTRIWFQRMEINPTLGDVGRAVQTAAKYNTFHPVRDYFASLAWDGKARLDTWLQTYFHVKDSKYSRAVGSCWLISGVARIYQPGCRSKKPGRIKGKRPKSVCAKCGQPRTKEGHDPCIANLPGVLMACCGHGVRDGYIMYQWLSPYPSRVL